jgi:hypothetical protein
MSQGLNLERGKWYFLSTKCQGRITGLLFHIQEMPIFSPGGSVQLKLDGTRWRTEGKWRGNWRMEWVAITLHTTSELGVSNITTFEAHTSAASSRLNWCPCRVKWTRLFRRKTKSGFCAVSLHFKSILKQTGPKFIHSYLSVVEVKDE